MSDAKHTVAERFLEAATARPDHPALVFPDVTFTYGNLRDLAATFALRFTEAGLDRSKTLRIVSEDPAVALPALLAAALLGVPVSTGPGEEAGAQVAIVTRALPAEMPQILVDLSFSPANFDQERKTEAWMSRSADANEPWFHSPSPSEAGPGPVFGLSQAEIVARTDAVASILSGDAARLAVLFPPASYHGLTRRLAALLAGGTVLELPASQLPDARGVTGVCAPVTAASFLASAGMPEGPVCELAGLRLSRDETASLLRGFRQVSLVLDLAETGPVLVTTAANAPGGVETAQTLLQTVEIVDSSGAPAMIGRLRIGDADCAIRPGIVARRIDDALELLGPATGTDALKVEDRVLDAAVIDALIASTEGVVAAVAFANPKPGHDDLLALVIFEEGVNRYQVVARAEQACRDALGAAAVPARMRPISEIPLRADGAPDRAACAEMILRAAGEPAANTARAPHA